MSRLFGNDDGKIIHDWLNTRVRTGTELNFIYPEIPEQFSSNLPDLNDISDNVNRETEDPVDSEGEADIGHIEAQREVNSDEFAGINYNVLINKMDLKLDPENEGGWKVQGGNKKRKEYVKWCSKMSRAMSKREAKQVRNVWELPIFQRWRLYKMWLESYIEKRKEGILQMQLQMRTLHQELCELRKVEDFFVCSQSHVVGMTTTGAAKYQDLVQHLNPKIVIVEEAAEILESHIVTSLAPGTEHVILIGDHQQLRPNPTVHMLAVKYGLNISLFERMLKNGMECYRLGIQHRMRPEIASLLVPHIYKKLQNHESVLTFENIKGIGKNVFFLTHNFKELQEYDSKSRVNEHEAKFIMQLCRYILLQGYEPSQITVLTTYSGQLFAIKKEMRKQGIDEGVKVTVVDNYQGEENDIILISFVRSNAEGNIGFLKISNRVCVALSRAKKGLFCIGNFELLAEKSDLWKNIVSTLKESKGIGPSLQLMCQNHPDVSSAVCKEEDFSSVPEGGCTRDCEFRLSCGHVCSLKCHPYDKEHENVLCYKPCNKKCNNGHLCLKHCYEDCGDCHTMVDKRVERCGHITQIFCYREGKPAVCPELCNRYLSCGYKENSIKGVLRNVNFINPDFNELEMGTSVHKINKYLVSFLTKFWKYLIQQGYKAKQITILTTDEDHFKAMKSKTDGKPCYSGLECVLIKEDTIIENDLMIVAFVQSTALKEMNFLEASNLACTILSQATKGVLCIGQFEIFAEKYSFWKDITNALKRIEAIGPYLQLQCQNHPDIREIIKNEKSFDCVREGGCTKNCDFLLSCGHICSLKCHPYDIEHNDVKCLKACPLKCNYGHLCSNKCWEDCGFCKSFIDLKLECGHIEKVACGHRNDKISCSQLCETYLPCGHMCSNKCGDPCETRCSQNIKIKSSICSHEVVVKCFEWDNKELLMKSCKAPCRIELTCGHLCQGTCCSCYQGRIHVACKNQCQRILVCGHKCYALCCESCPPCMLPCENKCMHSKCLKSCHEPCDKCSEPCKWFCIHKKCKSLCFENHSHTSCHEPCSKLLKCGHTCIGLCGQPCPEDCRICDKDIEKYRFLGSVDIFHAKYVCLEDCKHIFEVNGLTEWMHQDAQSDKAIYMKGCPKCNVIIRDNHLFQNKIGTCLKDIDTIKKLTYIENYDDKKRHDTLCAVRKIRDTSIKKMLLKGVSALRNVQEQTIMENSINILSQMEFVTTKFTKLTSASHSDTMKLKSYIEMTKKFLIEFLVREYFTPSEQQLQELVWEAHHLTLAYEVLNFSHRCNYEVMKNSMDSVITYAPFREEDAKELFIAHGISLQYLPDIKKMPPPIPKTKGLAKNNWFKCVRSHVYGVMQSFGKKQNQKCPECKEDIVLNELFSSWHLSDFGQSSDSDEILVYDSDDYLCYSDY